MSREYNHWSRIDVNDKNNCQSKKLNDPKWNGNENEKKSDRSKCSLFWYVCVCVCECLYDSFCSNMLFVFIIIECVCVREKDFCDVFLFPLYVTFILFFMRKKKRTVEEVYRLNTCVFDWKIMHSMVVMSILCSYIALAITFCTWLFVSFLGCLIMSTLSIVFFQVLP